VTYYSPLQVVPSSVQVNVGGTSYDMTLLLGTASRGQYGVAFPVTPPPTYIGCVTYNFIVTTADQTYYLPESGFYGTWYDGAVDGVEIAENLICYSNFFSAPAAQPPPVPPPSPLSDLPKACIGRAYWFELGPGLGPW